MCTKACDLIHGTVGVRRVDSLDIGREQGLSDFTCPVTAVVSISRRNTTFSEQPYIRWCCVDLLRSPRHLVKLAKKFLEQPDPRYRESSQTQLTSHVFPLSDEKDCSIRDDLGEMLSQT